MVDLVAPDPVPSNNNTVAQDNVVPMRSYDPNRPSSLKVVLIGAGGCGINRVRSHYVKDTKDAVADSVLYFDTSMTNGRYLESVNILGKGDGSGSHRQENAREIEQEIAKLSDEEMGGDVHAAIIVASLAGGSGSVVAPLLIREFVRRRSNGVRPIGVFIIDTSSAVGAKNTINTLKTLTAVAKNNDIYLPIILLSNDQPGGRRRVDQAAEELISDLLDLLTKQVFEVDRNDRLNWIDPSKVVGAQPGLKLISLYSDRTPTDSSLVLGLDSNEMVDSTLIIQNTADDELPTDPNKPMARLKKTGFFFDSDRTIIGKITGDIRSISTVIENVERVQQQDKSQRYEKLDRLDTSGSDDLIL